MSSDSRPLRGRQSGHFLETASLHPPLAALRRFPAPLPLTVQNIGVRCSFVRGVGDTSPYGDVRKLRHVVLTGGPMWASAPTTGSRNFANIAAGPACPAVFGRNTPCDTVGGDAHIAPPSDRNASSNLCRGRRPRRPAIGANAYTFQTVSGSGAERKSILHLGTVLQIPYLLTGKEVKKPSVSCASLVTFCAHRKSPAGGMDTPIPPPILSEIHPCGFPRGAV